MTKGESFACTMCLLCNRGPVWLGNLSPFRKSIELRGKYLQGLKISGFWIHESPEIGQNFLMFVETKL